MGLWAGAAPRSVARTGRGAEPDRSGGRTPYLRWPASGCTEQARSATNQAQRTPTNPSARTRHRPTSRWSSLLTDRGDIRRAFEFVKRSMTVTGPRLRQRSPAANATRPPTCRPGRPLPGRRVDSGGTLARPPGEPEYAFTQARAGVADSPETERKGPRGAELPRAPAPASRQTCAGDWALPCAPDTAPGLAVVDGATVRPPFFLTKGSDSPPAATPNRAPALRSGTESRERNRPAPDPPS
ncbi:hypothetical protein HRbin29_01694 [bacterium HR29]|jgi:hypothetical protein|nr:hypothetical protein HRbin29_01694 [bacterium HR29]